MLFEPDRHEALIDTPWDDGAARRAVAAIVADTRAAYGGPEALWPIHPLDVSPERSEVLKLLYYGAAGVIWALDVLPSESVNPDFGDALARLPERVLADSLHLNGRPIHAFHAGLLGVSMTAAKLSPGAVTDASIAEAMLRNIDDPSEGLNWGAAGSLLGALFLLERTGDAAWRGIATRLIKAIWTRWRWCESARCHLWRQDLYGEQAHQLGALHGFAGNAFVLWKGRDLLDADRRAELLRRVRQTMAATALRDGALVNWPFEAGGSTHPGSAALRVQHCMGAPGFVNALSGLPPDPEVDALLCGAGELIWRAGPPRKLPSLCHGAPGAGYAFLKLHARTTDAVWLDRARRFAMHALAQNERAVATHGLRKFSLWTGDLGLALYLQACIDVSPAMPTLDVF